MDCASAAKCDSDSVATDRAFTLSSGRGTWPHTMTRDKLDAVSIASSDEFEAILARLIEKAIEVDVDVRGAWEFRTGGSTHDWEVQIVELDREAEGAD